MDEKPKAKGWLKSFLIIGGGSCIFAYWMATSMLAEVEIKPSVLTPSVESQVAMARREEVETMLDNFSAAIREHRYDAAWNLMAAPYRSRQDAAAFESACKSSALLSGLAEIVVLTTREQQTAGHEQGRPGSFSARGVLKSTAGEVEVVVHVVWETDGPHVFSLLAGGVPLLSGIAP